MSRTALQGCSRTESVALLGCWALSDETSLSRAGWFRSLAYDKTLSIQVLQYEPRDHPLGCDAVRSVSTFSS